MTLKRVIQYIHLRGQRHIVLDTDAAHPTDATVLAPSHHRLLTARQRRAWKLVRGYPDSPASTREGRNTIFFGNNNRTLVLRVSRGKCRVGLSLEAAVVGWQWVAFHSTQPTLAIKLRHSTAKCIMAQRKEVIRMKEVPLCPHCSAPLVNVGNAGDTATYRIEIIENSQEGDVRVMWCGNCMKVIAAWPLLRIHHPKH